MLLATLDVLYLHNTIPEKNIDQCRPVICQCMGFVFQKQKNEYLHNQHDSHIPFDQSGPRYRTEIDSECIGCQPLCKSCNLLDLDTKSKVSRNYKVCIKLVSMVVYISCCHSTSFLLSAVRAPLKVGKSTFKNTATPKDVLMCLGVLTNQAKSITNKEANNQKDKR